MARLPIGTRSVTDSMGFVTGQEQGFAEKHGLVPHLVRRALGGLGIAVDENDRIDPDDFKLADLKAAYAAYVKPEA